MVLALLEGALGAPHRVSEGFNEHDAEVASLLGYGSQRLIVICSFNDDALVVAAVDEQEGFHGFEGEWASPPVEANIWGLAAPCQSLRDIGAERGHHQGLTRLCALGNGTPPPVPLGDAAGARGINLQERAAHGDGSGSSRGVALAGAERGAHAIRGQFPLAPHVGAIAKRAFCGCRWRLLHDLLKDLLLPSLCRAFLHGRGQFGQDSGEKDGKHCEDERKEGIVASRPLAIRGLNGFYYIVKGQASDLVAQGGAFYFTIALSPYCVWL